MDRVIRYAVATLMTVAPWLQLAAREREVPLIAGTTLQCTLNEQNLSSRSTKPGEPIVCYARPLNEFGCAAFPRGTLLAGRFLDYKDPGRLVGKGWMRLEFDRLVRADGEAPIAAKVISVRGFNVDSEGRILGRGHATRDAIGWAIPLLWPIKIVTLPARGPRPSLKGEKVITLRLLEDVQVPCGGFDTDGALRPGWHHFGSSSRNYDPDPYPRNSRTDTTMASGEKFRDGAPTDDEQRDSNNGPLVVESGHHVLVIASARGAKASVAPEPK